MTGIEAVIGPDIVVDESILYNHAIVVEEGLVRALVPIQDLTHDITIRDVGPGILTAGLIDTHTHGAGGHSFSEGDAEASEIALTTMLRAGITTVLPTLSSAPIDALTKGLEALGEMKGKAPIPRIPGTHLEGPYFSKHQRGAQDPAALRKPSDGSVDRLLEFSDTIRMMSFAPELSGAVELTRRLCSLGIIAAAGHSDGRDEDLIACQREGLSHVIHIFSGQSTTVRKGPWRHPGMLEATLASDELTVEMIADGKHLPTTLMKLAHRCIGERLSIVSDSNAGAGMPDGTTYRMGDKEFLVENGVGMTMDRSAFAGSTTLLSAMIPIAMEALQIKLPDVIAMATSAPAKAARLEKVGRITPGYHADFALFDNKLKVQAVALGGVWH
jgi:N-acetylglucosamine-6-phosphate deacetylase